MIKNSLPKYKTILYANLFMICLCLQNCNNENTKSTEAETVIPAPIQNNELAKLNYMRISAGKFITKIVDKVPFTTRQELKLSFEHLSNTDSNLVIYFHGGLIPINRAYTDPKKTGLDSTIRKAVQFPYYTLYGDGPGNVIWTGLQSNFADEKDNAIGYTRSNPLDSSIETVFKRKSFLYLLIQLNRKYNPNSKFSNASYERIQDTLNLEQILESEVQNQGVSSLFNKSFVQDKAVQKKLEEDLYRDTIFQDLARKELNSEQSLFSKKAKLGNFVKLIYDIGVIIVSSTNRFIKKRDHGIIMTITEEILHNSSFLPIKGVKLLAQKGWAQMKINVSKPFLNNPDIYGGRALLDELAALDSTYKAKGKVKRVYLIGSSTGAVMVCNLLITSAEKKYNNLKFHIILTVPACTFELLANTLYIAKQQISSLHIFALNDNTERNAGWPIPFPGTILYLVSGVCEPISERTHDLPIVGMQRFYKNDFINSQHISQKEKKDILKVMTFLGIKDGKSKNVVWSDEDCPDINLKNTGDKHGHVIRNADVQKSISYLLTH